MSTDGSLTSVFFTRFGEARASAMRRDSAFEEKLRAVIATARAAWPKIDLDDEAFAAALAERWPDGVDDARGFEGFHAADLYLAVASSNHDDEAMREFDRLLSASASAAIGRVAKNDAMRDEILQRIRRKL